MCLLLWLPSFQLCDCLSLFWSRGCCCGCSWDVLYVFVFGFVFGLCLLFVSLDEVCVGLKVLCSVA